MASIDPAAPSEPPTIEGSPDQLLRLLLDEERLAILGYLARSAATVDDLTAALAMKRATLTRHLAQLTAAGLICRAADDRIALDVAQIRSLKQTLFARPATPKPESSDAQVIATFVRNGKLIQFPAQQTKRQVILAWLAECFARGRDYSEREVNDLLRGHVEDHVTLRRYLVDAGHLTRGGGVYRRGERETQP